MPEFTTEIDIDPSEFIDACNSREKERLIEILEEDGYINTTNKNHGVKRPNVNDQIFWNSLDKLAKCRDLLSLEEEQYINKLAEKFKHIR
jgi:ribosomal protein S8